jgi:hypothetical protein
MRQKAPCCISTKGREKGLQVTKKEVSIQEKTADIATKHFHFSAKVPLLKL